MITLAVPRVEETGFIIEPIEATEPRFRFRGNGDTAAIAPLDRFLKLVHQEMLARSYTTISVDLGELYFMNSSCLKGFVSWIYGVNTGGQPYRIRLMSNARLHWQARSMATLQRLAPSVVEVHELAS
jgi:hypothetical protein